MDRFDKHRPDISDASIEYIREEDVVSFGDLWLRAIETPGHTSDSLSWAASLKGSRLFLPGDSLDFRKDGSTKRPPWIVSSDLIRSESSIIYAADRLIGDFGYDPSDVVAPSHSASGTLESVMAYSAALMAETKIPA